MRFLLPLMAVAQALGIWLADCGWLRPGAALTLGASALLIGVVTTGPRKRSAAVLLVVLAAGGLSLGVRLERARHNAVSRAFDTVLEARVCGRELHEGWLALELCEVAAVGSGGVALPLQLWLSEDRPSPSSEWLGGLRRGDRIRARTQLRPLQGLRNPGSRDRVRQLVRRGIGGRARLVDPALAVRVATRAEHLSSGRASSKGWSAVEVLRDRVSKVLAGRGDGGQLLRALAVGDRSGLTPGQRGAFNRLGVGHLLAVSGLHLALVAGFVFWMVRWVLVRMTRISERGDVRAAALVVAVLAAAFYAALTGWGVPVRRALVFVVVGVLSLVLGRRRSAPHLLSAASILILCSDPGVLFEMGAQLSFAASAALLVSASVDAPLAGGGLLRTLWRRVATGVRTTASAVAVTSPLVAWHGGGVGVAALLANVVAVPWVGFGLLPAALVSAGCAASGGGAADLLGDPRFEFGRPGLDWTCSVILDLGIWLARVTLLGVDRAAALAPDLRVGAAPVCWVLLLAMLLGALALRSRSVGGRLLLAWCVVLCLRLGPVSSVGPPPPRIVALDVGLGDAVLVQGESGALLVDGGGAWSRGGDAGRTAVLPALRALGVRRLDLIIATHADLDHRGGLTSVVEGVEVGELWLPPRGLVDPAFRSLIAAAHRRGSRAVERSADDPSARFGDLVVEPLWPPPHWRPPSRNDGSLVVRVAVGGGRVLLAGDLGERAERSLVDSGAELAAQVLKVGHHGSRGSASAGFLSAVGAELAIVSAPCGSTRHLPAFETLARIRGAGSALAWTGRDGALFISMGEPMFAWGWGRSRRDCGPWGDVR